jgi:hypothetical protein
VTCPFLEEQSGEGNSFNVLKLNPSANLFSIQRWKAGTDKQFVPHFPEPILQPLFRSSPGGYRIAQTRITNEIADLAGNCLVTHQRLGLVVDRKDFDLPNIAFGMGGSSALSELASFEYDLETVSSIKYQNQAKAASDGYFVLRQPMKQGSEPIDMWFTYELRKGFCMRRSEYQTYYPGRHGDEESAEVKVVHPCDQLSVVVQFPRKYAVEPRPRAIDQNGVEIDLNLKSALASFQPDRLANRFTLIIRRPQMQHRYSIFWQVPDL